MPPRQRRSRLVEDESDEEDRRPAQRQNRRADDTEEDEQEDGDSMEIETTADDQLAKKLIRYAIACEFSRTIIRREGIKEKVLGTQGRAFRKVFDLAQIQLRAVWGMELRELPVRERYTAQEKRKALQAQSQTKVSSGTYVLASTLPAEYRSANIITPSKAPSAESEASYAAFYTLVISLIWLSGGELSDPSLRRYLKRMNAEQNIATQSTDDVLKKMERQGYVIRKVEKNAATQTQDQAEDVLWLVGPRGREEVGIDGVAGIVREVYGESDRELDKKLAASLGVREPEQMEDADGMVEAPAEAGPSNGERRRRTRGRPVDEED